MPDTTEKVAVEEPVVQEAPAEEVDVEADADADAIKAEMDALNARDGIPSYDEINPAEAEEAESEEPAPVAEQVKPAAPVAATPVVPATPAVPTPKGPSQAAREWASHEQELQQRATALDQREAQLVKEYKAEFLAEYMAYGMIQDDADKLATKRATQVAQKELSAHRQAVQARAYRTAKELTAKDIATQYGVDSGDLMAFDTPQQMVSHAKLIQKVNGVAAKPAAPAKPKIPAQKFSNGIPAQSGRPMSALDRHDKLGHRDAEALAAANAFYR